MLHSGLQFGGLPRYSGRQEQLGIPPISLHCEFGPHGEGTQGFCISGFTKIKEGAESKFRFNSYCKQYFQVFKSYVEEGNIW